MSLKWKSITLFTADIPADSWLASSKLPLATENAFSDFLNASTAAMVSRVYVNKANQSRISKPSKSLKQEYIYSTTRTES